jgi:negative regulator of flagellin synthesis FlgM
MTSKIDSMSTVAVGLAGGAKAVSDKPATAAVASAQPAPPVDKVSLTGDAMRMQQLDKSMATGPEVDSGRVTSVKAAIAAGRYSIDARTVAAKLSRLEWEMHR